MGDVAGTIAAAIGGAVGGDLEGGVGEGLFWAAAMGGAHRLAVSAAQDECDVMHGLKPVTPKAKRCWS